MSAFDQPIYAVVDAIDANLIRDAEQLCELALKWFASPMEAFDHAGNDGSVAVFRVQGTGQFERID